MSEESESYMRGWQSGYHNATLAERERIIKLLEATIADWRRCDLYQQAELFDYAIQLIKGEQE
jgi:hypothetical protein